jgi:two-component system capsular synthesis sensor histidine kinase RcsC
LRSQTRPQADAEDLLALPERIRTLFVSSMEEDLDAIHAAMEHNDMGEIVRLLHRIRGALSVAGIPSLIAASREVEMALKDGVTVSSVPGLKRLLGRFQTLLNHLMDTN